MIFQLIVLFFSNKDHVPPTGHHVKLLNSACTTDNWLKIHQTTTATSFASVITANSRNHTACTVVIVHQAVHSTQTTDFVWMMMITDASKRPRDVVNNRNAKRRRHKRTRRSHKRRRRSHHKRRTKPIKLSFESFPEGKDSRWSLISGSTLLTVLLLY